MDNDPAAFLGARLDQDEAAARDHLCIHCRIPVVPLRNAFGITGYTHKSAEWAGKRCRGGVTGAEPVQNPERMLREIAAKRKLLERVAKAGGYGPANPGLRFALRVALAPYSDHPDYRPEWKP